MSEVGTAEDQRTSFRGGRTEGRMTDAELAEARARAMALHAAAGAATTRAQEAEDLLRRVVREYGHLCVLPECACAIAAVRRHVG